MSDLPIRASLPKLLMALNHQGAALLVAPPGAGKTSCVAPALLDENWCHGCVLLLAPRRLAARAAAEYMASLLGEKIGETVGYQTRLDSKLGAHTRIIIMTEAIFVARIISDPDLAGVSAVLFDEAHERHLDSDLALALAIEARGVLRPDLRLLVMSATLDAARFATLLGADTPVIESEGRAWPLDIRWLGRRPDVPLEKAMTSAIVTAHGEQEGDILAFLPGVREIERVREQLGERLPAASILPLHGGCEPSAQRLAVQRDRQGRRRIVLASAIAETSLTLDGVRIVVDSGLSRCAEFDITAGVTRLITVRASQAAATQRAGRAARQGPGIAYRLWEEASHTGRSSFDPPEILTADLAPLALTLAHWGANDPASMAWIDPPPMPALAAASARLKTLRALDHTGAITAHGRMMALMPMAPELAHMLLFCAALGAEKDGAELALLLQERGLGGMSDDLTMRREHWHGESSPRAMAARDLARRWAKQARQGVANTSAKEPPPLGVMLAEAYPDNLAKVRDGNGEEWLTAGGRGLRLDPASPLARTRWLAVGDAQGHARGARITHAIALDEADILKYLSHRIERKTILRWVAEERRVEANLESRIGALIIARGSDPAPNPEAIAMLLCDKVRDGGLDLLPLGASTLHYLRRAAYAGIESLSEPSLRDAVNLWLAPCLNAVRRLDTLSPARLHDALRERIEWHDSQTLDTLAPANFISPAGTQHAINYDDPGGPSVELRVQALFGLDQHPGFGRPQQPLLLKLTSPGGKPIQMTRDLPGFWRGSWRDVVKDMKGRYPKHRWPEEPWREDPGLKTKNAHLAQKRP